MGDSIVLASEHLGVVNEDADFKQESSNLQVKQKEERQLQDDPV